MNKPLVIDIVSLLGPDLKSRSNVDDLYVYMKNTTVTSFIIDFSEVQFVTRSFMDEFYNRFLKSSDWNRRVKLMNVSNDIQRMLDVVTGTQTRVKRPSKTGRVLSFRTLDEVNKYLKMLSF